MVVVVVVVVARTMHARGRFGEGVNGSKVKRSSLNLLLSICCSTLIFDDD